MKTHPPAWLPEPDLESYGYERETIDAPYFGPSGIALCMTKQPTGRATARIAFFDHPPGLMQFIPEDTVWAAVRMMAHFYAGAQA